MQYQRSSVLGVAGYAMSGVGQMTRGIVYGSGYRHTMGAQSVEMKLIEHQGWDEAIITREDGNMGLRIREWSNERGGKDLFYSPDGTTWYPTRDGADKALWVHISFTLGGVIIPMVQSGQLASIIPLCLSQAIHPVAGIIPTSTDFFRRKNRPERRLDTHPTHPLTFLVRIEDTILYI